MAQHTRSVYIKIFDPADQLVVPVPPNTTITGYIRLVSASGFPVNALGLSSGEDYLVASEISVDLSTGEATADLIPNDLLRNDTNYILFVDLPNADGRPLQYAARFRVPSTGSGVLNINDLIISGASMSSHGSGTFGGIITDSSLTGDGLSNSPLGVAVNGIRENHLSASNDPTDGQILSYSQSTGSFTWIAPGTAGGGGITAVRAGRGLGGGGSSGEVELGIVDNGIVAGMIEDGQITTAKLGANSPADQLAFRNRIGAGITERIDAGDGIAVSDNTTSSPSVAVDQATVPYIASPGTGQFIRKTATGWDTVTINTGAHPLTGVAAENGLTGEVRTGVLHIGVADDGITPARLQADSTAQKEAMRDRIEANGEVANATVYPAGVADVNALETAFSVVLSGINTNLLEHIQRVEVEIEGVRVHTQGWNVFNENHTIINFDVDASEISFIRGGTSQGQTVAKVDVLFYNATTGGQKVADVSTRVGIGASKLIPADKGKLDGIAPHAEVNVQADWDATDTHSDRFIRNKPTPVYCAARFAPGGLTAATTEAQNFALIFDYINNEALAGVQNIRITVAGNIVYANTWALPSGGSPAGGILYFSLVKSVQDNVINNDSTHGVTQALIEFYRGSFQLTDFIGRAFAHLGVGSDFFNWG